MSSKGKQELKKLKASLEESRVNGQDTAEGKRLNISAVDFHTTLANLQHYINRIYNHTHGGESHNVTMDFIRAELNKIHKDILPLLNKSIDSILKESDHLKTQAVQFAYLAGRRMGRTPRTAEQVTEMIARFQEELEQQPDPRPNSNGAPYFNE